LQSSSSQYVGYLNEKHVDVFSFSFLSKLEMEAIIYLEIAYHVQRSDPTDAVPIFTKTSNVSDMQ
jgi:hypothetical protein